MMSLLAQFFAAFFLSVFLMLMVQFLNYQTMYSRSKNSPFECGFDPFNYARLPFSQRFFLLAIIFLIFDIEIALLFPLILTLKLNYIYFSYLSGGFFLVILFFGLIHEWNQGTLSWVN